jgi:Ferritin-like domain
VENPTRRRVLAAGLTGTALGLLGGRVASASPDTTEPSGGGSTPESTTGTTAAPATTTTLPPKRPTESDIGLLNFAESIELTARDLYQAAIEAGVKDDLVNVLVANHRGYADILKGILGTDSRGEAAAGLHDQLQSGFQVTDVKALTEAAYDLESTLVATHIDLLSQLEGTDGARTIASILIVEARQAAVLADAAGKSGDFDALFDNTATALTPPSGG